MSMQELLPLAVLFSSLVPGLAIFALPESWIGVRTTLNLFGAFAKLGLVFLLLAGVHAGSKNSAAERRQHAHDHEQRVSCAFC